MTSEPYPIHLSVVIPVHNEESNCRPLYDRLIPVLDSTGRSYEILWVDDGSTDDTPTALEALARLDSRVVVVTLKRNFGQTAALAAGFDHTSGAIIVSMDGDLQHDPSDIPALLAVVDGGADIASGWRKNRSTVDGVLRTVPSLMANRLARRVSGVDLHDFGTTFKAYRKEILDDVELHGDMHRFIPALASRRGARIVEVPIKSVRRLSGKSHYGLSRAWAVLIDLIVLRLLLAWFGRPLRAFAAVGVPLFSLGFLVALAASFRYYFVTHTIGYGDLILASLLMILGVQFIGMGLLAEIGARGYHAARNRTVYTVRTVRGRAGAGSGAGSPAGSARRGGTTTKAG